MREWQPRICPKVGFSVPNGRTRAEHQSGSTPFAASDVQLCATLAGQNLIFQGEADGDERMPRNMKA